MHLPPFRRPRRLARPPGRGLALALLAGVASVAAGAADPAAGWRVEAVQGSAWIQRDGAFQTVREGSRLQSGDTVELGSRSRLRVSPGRGGTFEFGSHARFVVAPEPARALLAKGIAHATAARDPDLETPLTIESSGWRVHPHSGAVAVDAGHRRSIACRLAGDARVVAPDGHEDALAAADCVELAPQALRPAPTPTVASTPAWRDTWVPGSLLQASRSAPDAPGTREPVREAQAPAGAPAPSPVVVPVALAASAPPAAPLAATLEPPASAREAPDATWIVNVASFSDPARGQTLVRALQSRGFAASLRSETVHGLPSYRAIVGGLPSEHEADTVASVLAQRYGLASAWVMRTR